MSAPTDTRPPAPAKRRVRLLSLREMSELPLPTWRIYHLLSGLSVLWAGPGSFKTFLAISWAVAVASDRPWFGRRVQQGSVVFIVGEGGLRAFYNRVSVAGEALGLSREETRALPIYATEGAVDLSTWTEPQAQQLREAALAMAAVAGAVGLLVVDTVSRCLTGKENDQDVVAAFVGTLDSLRLELKCDVVAIHHANADGDRPRGSTVLPAAADGVLHVKVGLRSAAGEVPLALYAHKLKEAEAGPDLPPVASLLAQPVPVFGLDGKPVLDEDGQPVKTCKLIENTAAPTSAEACDEALLAAIPEPGGISGNNLARKVGRQKRQVQADLERLQRQGKVQQHGKGPASRWHRIGSTGSESVPHRTEPTAPFGSTGSGSIYPDQEPIARTGIGPAAPPTEGEQP